MHTKITPKLLLTILTLKLLKMNTIKIASIYSIAFAEWIITEKNLPREIMDALLSDIKSETIWERFLASDDYNTTVKTAVDVLIPELVESKGKKGKTTTITKSAGNHDEPADVVIPPKRTNKKKAETETTDVAATEPKKRGRKPKNPVVASEPASVVVSVPESVVVSVPESVVVSVPESVVVSVPESVVEESVAVVSEQALEWLNGVSVDEPVYGKKSASVSLNSESDLDEPVFSDSDDENNEDNETIYHRVPFEYEGLSLYKTNANHVTDKDMNYVGDLQTTGFVIIPQPEYTEKFIDLYHAHRSYLMSNYMLMKVQYVYERASWRLVGTWNANTKKIKFFESYELASVATDSEKVATATAPKKRGPKPKVAVSDESVSAASVDTASVAAASVAAAPVATASKKRGPKPKVAVSEPKPKVAVSDETESVASAGSSVAKKRGRKPKSEEEKAASASKKRGPKPKVAVSEPKPKVAVSELNAKDSEEKEVLTLEPVEKKKTVQVAEDIVTPVSEQDQLELSFQNLRLDGELAEETFEEEDGIVVTERFIGDVLYYVDDEDNWYNSAYEPVEKPANV